MSQYRSRASFLRLNFQNRISQSTGKYELGWYLLRQSHIIMLIPVLESTTSVNHWDIVFDP